MSQNISIRTMKHKDGKPRKVLYRERLTQNGKRYNLTKLAARKRLKARLK